MKFAVGLKANEEMEKEQLQNQIAERLYYKRMAKSMGSTVPIYLWLMRSTEPGTLISDISLSHSHVVHKLYKDLSEDGWHLCTHPEMVCIV